MTTFYRRRIKRLVDLALTLPALLVLTPVTGAVALAVRLRLGAPILFRQQRPGHHGIPFTLYKFRTMTNARSARGDPLPDHERLTPLGNFLRQTSLDELPELLNVLKGEMSLVGPRPLRVEYLPLYTAQQARRHDVRPGISGWAQVNGRNLLDWDERFRLDVWYADNISLWLDIKILLLTVWQVVRRSGISAPGHATMPRFTGSRGSEAK